MSLRILSDVDGAGKPSVELLGTYRHWTMVHLQVYGPQTLRIAKDRGSLSMQLAGLNGGLSIVAADGIVSRWWRGELWGTGSGSNTTVDIEAIE